MQFTQYATKRTKNKGRKSSEAVAKLGLILLGLNNLVPEA